VDTKLTLRRDISVAILQMKLDQSSSRHSITSANRPEQMPTTGKPRYHGDAKIARTDIASDNAAPDSRGGHRETGHRETISQGWTSRDLTMWHQIKQRCTVFMLN